jgi:hypothetical protein
VGVSVYDETQAYLNAVILNAASGTTPASVWAVATAWRQRLDKILATNQSAVDHVLGVYVHVGATNYRIGAVKLLANAGDGTVPTQDLIASINPLVGGLALTTDKTIYVGCDVTLAGAETITLCAIGGQI